MGAFEISRSFTIVSSGGTMGTHYQRLLAFTIAGRKAPAGVVELVVRSSRAALRRMRLHEPAVAEHRHHDRRTH